MSKNKIVGLGEMLVRFSAPRGILIREARQMNVCYGGGEANVLVSLSAMGYPGRYLTKMSTSDLGEAAMRFLREYSIDTTYIVRDSRPLGEYFLEDGEGSRPSKCIYHRKDSAATYMQPDDFDWDKAFEDACMFHGSGITLSLSDSSATTMIKAYEEAKKHGVKTSFDFNYRSHMLSLEKAKEIFPEVAKRSNIVFASPWDIREILGFEPDQTDDDTLFHDACMHFGWDYLFTKKRNILSARNQEIRACGYTKTNKFKGRNHRFEIYGRIGAGDAFAAGCLAGLLENYEDGLRAVDLGTANCILKQSISGDQSKFSKEDLDRYLKLSGSGEVIR